MYMNQSVFLNLCFSISVFCYNTRTCLTKNTKSIKKLRAGFLVFTSDIDEQLR